MAERGLIERISGPGRAVRHRITAKGEQVRADGEGRIREVRRRSFAGLSAAQVDQLADLLNTVLATPLEPADAPKPSRHR
jgi:DNA-binding MarR family transcriptional regulator